jgi:hypothetical protein
MTFVRYFRRCCEMFRASRGGRATELAKSPRCPGQL